MEKLVNSQHKRKREREREKGEGSEEEEKGGTCRKGKREGWRKEREEDVNYICTSDEVMQVDDSNSSQLHIPSNLTEPCHFSFLLHS